MSRKVTAKHMAMKKMRGGGGGKGGGGVMGLHATEVKKRRKKALRFGAN